MTMRDELNQNFGMAHCAHHAIHFEWCFGFKKRLAVIDRDKPKSERAVRQANFWLFAQADLPSWAKVDAAWAKADAEGAKYDAAVAKADAAWAKADAAGAKYDAAEAKVAATWAKADAAWVKANAEGAKYAAAWAKTDAAGVKAAAAGAKYLADNLPAIQALHDKLVAEQGYICTWNGKDIFSKEAQNEPS